MQRFGLVDSYVSEIHYTGSDNTIAVHIFKGAGPLKIDNNFATAWNNKGFALCEFGDYVGALECWEHALKLNNNNNRDIIWNSKGYVLHRLGDYKEAIKCYDHALKFNKNCTSARIFKGIALYVLAQYSDAYQCFQTVVKQNNQSIHALLFQAHVGLVLQKNDEVVTLLKSVDKLLTSEPSINLHVLFHQAQALLAETEQRPQEATTYFAKVEEQWQNLLKSQQVILLLLRYPVYASRLKNLQKAQETLTALLQIEPQHAWAQQMLKTSLKPSAPPLSVTYSTAPSPSATPLEDTSLQQVSWSALQIGRRIGSGKFGEVYQATWRGNSVAVKSLFLKQLQEELLADFKHEAALMANLPFPQIVRLFAICLEPNHYAMVMEYLPKGALYDVLHNSKEDLPWTLRWQIALDVARGVAYLHERNIIHRDLKSLNVLLDDHYRAKIGDFGLSKVKLKTSVTTFNEKSMGTVRWMAPELFGLRPKYSTASDIYALAIVLWDIAMRLLPYQEQIDDLEIRQAVKDADREDLPKDAPYGYADLIKKCWAQRADQRLPADNIVKRLETLQPEEKKEPQKVAEKSWHFDETLKPEASMVGNYTLIPAPPNNTDVQKVVTYYQHHPVPGMEIKSVKTIYNPTLNRSFALQLKLLQERHNNPSFTPNWHNENAVSWRAHTDRLFQTLAKPYTDSDFPAVKLLPLWH